MDQTVTNMLLAAVTGLSGVVAYLYKQQIIYHIETVKRLSDCEEDRLNLWEKLAGLQDTIQTLQKKEKDDRDH